MSFSINDVNCNDYVTACVQSAIKRNFSGSASVISRPVTCQVSVAGAWAFFCVAMEVVLCWKFCLAHRLTFDSIFYSDADTCFVYPSANRTLLLQERTGHLGAQPLETHVYPNCFYSSLFFWLVLEWILQNMERHFVTHKQVNDTLFRQRITAGLAISSD